MRRRQAPIEVVPVARLRAQQRRRARRIASLAAEEGAKSMTPGMGSNTTNRTIAACPSLFPAVVLGAVRAAIKIDPRVRSSPSMNAPQASGDDVAAKIGASIAPQRPSRIAAGRGSAAESSGAPNADAAKNRAIGVVASPPLAGSPEERGPEIPDDLAPSSQMRVTPIPALTEVAERGCLHVRFTQALASSSYALALASLFSPAAEEMIVEDTSGRLRDDLDIRELRQRLEAGLVTSLRFQVRLLGVVANLRLALDRASSPASATVTVRLALGAKPTGTLWLQADLAHLGPLPVLALPAIEGAFTQDALHALIAVTAAGSSTDEDDAIVDGVALTQLLRAASFGAPLGAVFGQIEVDALRQTEWLLAAARVATRLESEHESRCLEGEIGVVGAASGLMSLAYGFAFLRHGAARRERAAQTPFAAWAIARDGRRGVAIAETAP